MNFVSKIVLISLALLLTACEANRYKAIDGIDNSHSARSDMWKQCSQEAYHKKGICGGGPDSGFKGCDFGMTPDQAVTAAAFGGIGGAIGGAVVGGVVAGGAANNSSKKTETDIYTDECMANHGYYLVDK